MNNSFLGRRFISSLYHCRNNTKLRQWTIHFGAVVSVALFIIVETTPYLECSVSWNSWLMLGWPFTVTRSNIEVEKTLNLICCYSILVDSRYQAAKSNYGIIALWYNDVDNDVGRTGGWLPAGKCVLFEDLPGFLIVTLKVGNWLELDCRLGCTCGK